MAESEPKYLPPDLEAEFLRLRGRWRWALATPLVYLIGVEIARTARWFEASAGNYLTDTDHGRYMLAGVVGASLAVLMGIRLHQFRVVRRSGGDADEAFAKWMRDFYALIICADSVAFVAAVYDAVHGKFGVLLAGGVVAYLGYALASPRRADLAKLAGRN